MRQGDESDLLFRGIVGLMGSDAIQKELISWSRVLSEIV